jgi:uncharacterized cupin superfamily protein
MSTSILITPAITTHLQRTPISPDWVLEGTPETRSEELARSRDLTSFAMVWDCTAGRFNWNYNKDETLVVLSGEAFITIGDIERRIGPGDVVFFPAGSSASWRVPQYISKVAFLRHTMPRAAGFGVLAWNKFLRVVGLAANSPAMGTAPLSPDNAAAR